MIKFKFLIISFICVVLLVFPTFTQKAKPLEGHFSVSEECAKCHQAIYKVWSNSMHAKAIEDPIFKLDYLHALNDYGDTIRGYCIHCHSPTVRYTGDIYLKNRLSQEGVSCDFCHSINSVDLENPEDPFKVDPAGPQYGPYENASSPAHPSSYSELHTRAEFCAGCHELKNSFGVLVLGTYSEWKESQYAQQEIHCQNCHMPKVFGEPIVDPRVKKSELHMTAHEFLGGHSEINLQNAATIESRVELEKGEALVTVFVTNAESGHKLPTGTPVRKVVLSVKLFDKNDKKIAQGEKVYQKVLVDRSGNILKESYKMILEGTSILSDNRLAPKETRVEKFKFELPPEIESFSADISLRYQYPTPVLTSGLMEVEMAKELSSFPAEDVYTSGFLSWLRVFVILIFLFVLLWIGFRWVKKRFL